MRHRKSVSYLIQTQAILQAPEVPGSKLDFFDLHTFYLHLSRLDFASDVSLRIRSRVLTLSAWSLFVFRHGRWAHHNEGDEGASRRVCNCGEPPKSRAAQNVKPPGKSGRSLESELPLALGDLLVPRLAASFTLPSRSWIHVISKISCTKPR